MPLDVEFTWKQTPTTVVLSIPLRGVAARHVDIMVTDLLVKVSFERYLLQLDLLHPVEDASAVAKVKQGTLQLTLRKQEAQPWVNLAVQGATKAELRERRAQAIEAKTARDRELDERARSRRVDDERKALRKQMALEEAERQQIDDLKAEEKNQAEAEVYRTFAELEQQKARESIPKPTAKPVAAAAAAAAAAADEDELGDVEEDMVAEILTGEVPGAEAKYLDARLDELASGEADEEAASEDSYELVERPDDGAWPAPVEAGDGELDESAYRPAPREGGVVKFNFTPRLFPTPMRESKACEEEDWIAKNRSHLRKNPMLKPQLDAMDIEDSDPTWLKGKGDDFYRARDYRAAVNAYTTALELDPLLLPVLSNRAACYLQLGELVRCIEDSDQLIDELDKRAMSVDANPNDEGLKKLRVKGLARRGTAACQQGDYTKALEDYKRAVVASEPPDAQLIADLHRVDALAQCSELKQAADALFGQGDLPAAADKYGEALAIESTFVSAISNRAACYLALGSCEACVADCSVALTLLEVNPSTALMLNQPVANKNEAQHQQKLQQQLLGMGVGAGGRNSAAQRAGGLVPTGPVPPVGSAKRRAWVLKTIARRGTALSQLHRTDEAVADFKVACSLDPDNQELQRDLALLEERLQQETATETPPTPAGAIEVGSPKPGAG